MSLSSNFVVLGLVALSGFFWGCDDTADETPVADSGFDAAPGADVLSAADATENPGADAEAGACQAQIRTFPILPSPHILAPNYDARVYNSNPPSSGPHCSVWGRYDTFQQTPLPRCNYIHNLEHGAVVLLYNCPEGCPEITGAFAELVANYNHDSVCPRPRLIITPDAALTTKVAAAAWGATFTANCLDVPALRTLEGFARDRYNRAPEDVCASGGVAP